MFTEDLEIWLGGLTVGRSVGSPVASAAKWSRMNAPAARQLELTCSNVPSVTTRPLSKVNDWVGEMGEVGADMRWQGRVYEQMQQSTSHGRATQIAKPTQQRVPIDPISYPIPPYSQDLAIPYNHPPLTLFYYPRLILRAPRKLETVVRGPFLIPDACGMAAPSRPKRAPTSTAAEVVEVHHPQDPSRPSSPSTERSPLLGERPRAPRRRWRPFVGWLMLIALVGSVAVVFSSVGLEDPADDPQPVQFAEPRVDIVGIDDSGIRLHLSMFAGVDADEAIVQESHGSWWTSVARRSARAAMGLGVKSLLVDVPEIAIYADGGKHPLLQVQVPQALNVPVIRKDDPLEPFAFEAIARPVAPMGASWDWLQRAWQNDHARLVVSIPKARVNLPAVKWLSYSASEMSVPFEGRSEYNSLCP